MERFLYRQLLAWKSNEDRKPLLLQGARQVGKTFLLKEFAGREYRVFDRSVLQSLAYPV